jgi:hypothetical protein
MPANESQDHSQNSDITHLQDVASTLKILTEEVFSLLEERLMVDFTQRKIGEIVVRKEIDTHILQVEVPIRREKLIVEQVDPEYKQLAEINLGRAGISDKDYVEAVKASLMPIEQSKQPTSTGNQSTQSTISGEITSPRAARDLLSKIANMPSHDCETIRIEIVLKDSKHQDIYQELFEHHSQI